jgi:hypothetical protein
MKRFALNIDSFVIMHYNKSSIKMRKYGKNPKTGEEK